MNRQRATKLVREATFTRAGGRCEAGQGCPNAATDLHHVLPRSRARRRDMHILDEWGARQIADGETPDLPWLLALCDRCHRLAHGNPRWAEAMGMLVRGYVTTGPDGTPVYTGGWPPLVAMFPGVAA